MTKIDHKLLADNGWTVECESPFEIRHEDGSFATLNAAEIVLESFVDEMSVDWKRKQWEAMKEIYVGVLVNREMVASDDQQKKLARAASNAADVLLNVFEREYQT